MPDPARARLMKQYRERAGMTQAAFAAALKLADKSVVSNVECGQRGVSDPLLELARRVAEEAEARARVQAEIDQAALEHLAVVVAEDIHVPAPGDEFTFDARIGADCELPNQWSRCTVEVSAEMLAEAAARAAAL